MDNKQVFLRDLALLLREIRLIKKLTQEKVTKDTRVHIARLENFHRSMQITTLYKLSDYYGVPVWKILAEVEHGIGLIDELKAK